MSSLFKKLDQEAQQGYPFWMPSDLRRLPELYRGVLTEVTKSGALKSSNYILTRTSLVKCDQRGNSMVPLSWKRLEPFIEENQLEIKYGFRLGHHKSYKDFYVETQESLDAWISNFSFVCIMDDLQDDFDIIKNIGKGNFADVYMGLCNETNKKFAIKSIKKDKLDSEEILEHLFSEIKIMRKIDHPNIIKLHKVYESGSHIHLIIDYAEGASLFERFKFHKFSENNIARIALQLTDILKYLASINIVHRDIKLENILLDHKENDYKIMLADFGLAAEATLSLKQRCGSPGYVAPEILKKHYYDCKADVFSAGIVIYILVFGRMPLVGSNMIETLMKNQECKINFTLPKYQTISKNCVNFIQKMTEVNPTIRSSASELMNHEWLISCLSNPQDSTKRKDAQYKSGCSNPTNLKCISQVDVKNCFLSH